MSNILDPTPKVDQKSLSMQNVCLRFCVWQSDRDWRIMLDCVMVQRHVESIHRGSVHCDCMPFVDHHDQ